MEKKVRVAILGAGTAGLSALREVRKLTQDFVLINGGHYGTTCARVGCMPSKVLIQAANDYHRRHKFEELGIRGGESLSVDTEAVMERVRSLRDRFVRSVMPAVEAVGEASITGYAKFVEPNVIEVNGDRIRAEKIILATGSRPVIADTWKEFGDDILTSDEIFEQKTLPKRLLVVGLGVIGLELGQALSRLGVEVIGVGRSRRIGGLTDPEILDYAIEKFSEEFPLHFGNLDLRKEAGSLVATVGNERFEVDKVLACMGRRPNLDNIGLENLGLSLDERGIPKYNPNTMQVEGQPLFIAGDVNAERSILHEAADEGRIAGYNCLQESPECFRRRSSLAVTFCEPNLARAGLSYQELKGRDFAVGEVSFEGQGRSLVMAKNKGVLRVYGDKSTGKLVGAEMMAPSGEHLAHLLSWCIQQNLDVIQVLQFPFYHPVVEEGLRTALRDLVKEMPEGHSASELARCRTDGVQPIC